MATLYREATSQDSLAIATLHAESWRAHYRGAYSDEYLDGEVFEERISVWNERLSAPPENQYLVLAEDEGRLVGFACAYGRDEERWGSLLDNLHVRTELHRHGTGTRLVLEVAAWCESNYPDCGLYLWVLGQNDRARRFYEHLGASDEGGEFRMPTAGGGLARTVHRYVWTTLSKVVAGA